MSLHQWIDETLKLLDLEWQAENQLAESVLDNMTSSRLQHLGVSIVGIVIESVKSGMFGRSIARLSRMNKQPLHTHSISPGDVVRLVDNVGKHISDKPLSGVVARVDDRFVDVAFGGQNSSDISDIGSILLRLDKLPHEVTHQRHVEVLHKLQNLHPYDPPFQIREILFEDREPSLPLPSIANKEIFYFDDGLNEPQKHAVQVCVESRDVAAVHGPPGTGKTTTVVEIIRQLAEVHNCRILVCAPSNVAVDNIILKLAKTRSKKINMVRIGHPARVLPEVLNHTMDAVIQNSDASQILSDIRIELQGVIDSMSKSQTNKKSSKTRSRALLREEAKTLRRELKIRSQKASMEALTTANVVLTTNTGVGGITKICKESVFDVVIIDEAAQATEVSCWLPMMMGKRVILAGDHKQLPPTIKCDAAQNGVMGKTMFDRVVNLEKCKSSVCLLSIQYRMNHLISDWSSNEMYEGRLVSDESVAHRIMSGLPHVTCDETFPVLQLIDTAFCGFFESVEDADDSTGNSMMEEICGSRFNEGEADLVKMHVTKLVKDMGLRQEEIAVISPYNAQVHLLKGRLEADFPRIEVRTVDGFQGREKEAVVLSLVRSSETREVGFLKDDRRMNVALTRAKRHVCLICDSDTISSESGSFLARMIDYFLEHADVESAQTYDTNTAPSAYHAPSSAKSSIKSGKKAVVKKPVHKEPPLTETRRTELEGIVRVFMDSQESSFKFSESLTPAERHCVHELSETYNLGHESKGDGTQRHIMIFQKSTSPCSVPITVCDTKAPAMEDVSQIETSVALTENQSLSESATSSETICALNEERKPSNTDENGSVNEMSNEEVPMHTTDQPLDEASTSETVPTMEEFAKLHLPAKYQELLKSGLSPNEACLKSVELIRLQYTELYQNIQPPQPPPSQLDSIRQAAALKYHTQKAEKIQEVTKATKSKAKKKKPKKSPPGQALPEGMNDDELLNAAVAQMQVCGVAECDASVKLYGTNCVHCNIRYCYNHGQAEMHGCTTAARKSAREDYRNTATRSGPAPAKLKSHQRNYLQKKLAEKLAEESQSRQAKSKDKTSKKR